MHTETLQRRITTYT